MKAVHFVCFGLMLVGTLTLAQSNPVPFVNQPLVPDAAAPGGSSFTLTVNGTGFGSGAIVNWNGAPLTTNFVSSSQLTATVSASDIAVATTASVTVVNPNPAGGTSNVQFFTVSVPTLTPTFADYVQSVEGIKTSALYPTPTALIAADFNHDGKLDLAGSSDSAFVMIGNGDGTFQPPVNYTVGSAPHSLIATADFNGDGNPDLAVVNGGDGTVSILLSNGDGTFQSQIILTVDALLRTALVTGDFNGDGKLDLAIGGSAATVFVFLGNGDGTFQPSVAYPTGLTPDTLLLAMGDFNGEGRLDLAAVTFEPGLEDQNLLYSVLAGNGDGTFTSGSPVSFLPDPKLGPLSVVAADVNGDGKLDLVMDNGYGVGIFLGNGDGTFQPPLESLLSATFPSGFASIDFNADDKLDLGYGPELLLGSGDGTFLQTNTPSPISIPCCGLAAGDFNGDGKMDMVFPGGVFEGPGVDPVIEILLQGLFPSVNLSPFYGLSFGAQDFGITSLPEVVALTNTGTATLTISNISIAGANFAEFAQTNACGKSLAASASCQVNVTFTPTAGGDRSALLSVTDNAVGSPQSVALYGAGQSLGLGLPSGGSNSATVSAGDTATYTLSIGGQGLRGIAAITCTGAPATVTCSVPSTVSVSDTNASTFTVSVSTMARTSAGLRKRNSPAQWLWATALLGVVILPKTDKSVKRKLRRLGWLPLLLIVFIASCGGNTSSGAGAGGTPAGAYTLTVTASLGDTAQSQTLKLIVQ